MFCPKCAVENQNDTRFCRGCGTDLDGVALALNSSAALTTAFNPAAENRIELAQQRQQLQVDGIRRVAQGALIFIAGTLLGIPLYFFRRTRTGTQTGFLSG